MIGRFKLDENLPLNAEVLLGDAGHDVETVLSERLSGKTDSTILAASRAEKRILVTLDLDFADIRVYPPSEYPGVWILRPSSQSIQNILVLLKAALALFATEPTRNRLWIVEPGRIRIHE